MSESLFYAGIGLSIFFILIIMLCVYKFFCNSNNSTLYTASQDEKIRNSSIVNFFSENQDFSNQNAQNINGSFNKSNITVENIDLLLNLVSVKDESEQGLPKDLMNLLRKKIRVCTEDDLRNSDNTTENIKNLSSSFSMNTDPHIKSKSSCMFCLENLNMGEKIIYLPQCQHLLHANCFEDWFKNKSYCPLCKQNFL